jgi:hypothetical protein
MSLGGGANKQQQSNTQSSQSTGESQQFGSELWGGQSPFLQDLYARAGGTLGNTNGTTQAYLNQGSDFMTNATGTLNRSTEALTGMLNPQDDPMLARYAANMGQQFNEQFLPGLKGDAALAGGLGGSRQQIGAALGAQRGMQAIGDMTAQTYSDQQNRRLAAATAIGGNAAGYSDMAGLTGQLAEFGQSMPWYGLSQYAGLLGSPITLDKGGFSKQQSTGSASGSGSASGWNAKGGIGGG